MNRKLAALVVGNSAYAAAGTLANPTNDAHDIAAKLKSFGFSAILKTDCTSMGMDLALKEFKALLARSEVGLFFFAGHGMQIDGENYLAAVDTDVSGEIEAKHTSLPLNRVIETMEKSLTSTNIIILDACRDNPYERAWHRSVASRGLASVYAPKGTLIAFATSPGQIADDGVSRNGAYTAALLQHIEAPDCSIEAMFKRVRNTLSAVTKQKQISWEHTSLSGEFVFNLSLGVRIDAYSATALSDSLFVLNGSEPAHRLIQELKTLTWPRQNPAVEGFTAAHANSFSDDALFVIGRNIYQSACGGSNGAASYLKNFMSKVQGILPTKRKALLDGMLFEVFFDSNSKFRAIAKERRSGDLFSLQQYPDLSTSFDFISECLLSYAEHFYAVPGRNHEVAVHVIAAPTPSPGGHVVEEVHFGGKNIFRVEPDGFANTLAPPVSLQSLGDFERQIAREMVIARHLLNITYNFDKNSVQHVAVPYGGTTRRKS